MALRKYISEFGLNMVNGACLLLQQEHLDQIDQAGIDPHIYVIGRRPRIMLNPHSVKVQPDRISGEFLKQVKGESIAIPFNTLNGLGTHSVQLKCEYPYTEFAFVDDQGESILHGKSAMLLGVLGPKYWEHLDLEILYVGQAYGKEGSRTAADRLKQHETLQGIYAEAIRRSPDQEAWIVVSEFESLLLASIDGRSTEFTTTTEEDDEHIKTVTSTQITEQQMINFTEAALIKYFQPPYNKIFKDTFPNPAHSTYSECYDIDLNMVCVEFQTEELRLRLWSEAVQPAWIHFCSFPLHSREERQYMFEIEGTKLI